MTWWVKYTHWKSATCEECSGVLLLNNTSWSDWWVRCTSRNQDKQLGISSLIMAYPICKQPAESLYIHQCDYLKLYRKLHIWNTSSKKMEMDSMLTCCPILQLPLTVHRQSSCVGQWSVKEKETKPVIATTSYHPVPCKVWTFLAMALRFLRWLSDSQS